MSIIASVGQSPDKSPAALWNPLPRNGQFNEIPDTKMDQLSALLNPTFVERGTVGNGPGRLSVLMTAWSGACVRGTDMHLPRGAGHDDGCNNGWFRFRGASLKWDILRQPCDFSDAEWAASNALWTAAGYGNPPAIDRNHWYDPADSDWMWPSTVLIGGVPTSQPWPNAQHSYGCNCNAAAWGIFNLRDHVRRYNVDTQPITHTVLSGPVGGGPIGDGEVPSDAWSLYSPTHDRVYLGADLNSEYGHLFEIDPSDGSNSQISAHITQWSGTEATPIEGTEQMYTYSRNYDVAHLIDFSQSPPTATAVGVPRLSGVTPFGSDPTNQFSAPSLFGLFHSTGTGLRAIQRSGNMLSIDISSGACTDLGSSGLNQTLLNKTVNGHYGRMQLVNIDASNKGIVFPISTDENVRVMAL